MTQNHLITDFTAGEISEKLSGRVDLELYYKGCSKLRNFLPMIQGGVRRRPSTQYVGEVAGKCRLIPFCPSKNTAYLLEFTHLVLRIWHNDELMVFGDPGEETSEIASPYTAAQIADIQYAQTHDRIFFAHRGHKPRMLILGAGEFTWQQMEMITNADKTKPFNSSGNYPRAVAFLNSRLWFAGTDAEPATLWASALPESGSPVNYENHTYYKTVTTTTLEPTEPETWEDPELPEHEWVTRQNNITTDAHAIKITLGSEKNEEIQWMIGRHHLVVFTSSGEWTISGDITALSQFAQLQTRYGASGFQGELMNDAVLFVQSDHKRIREYYYLSQEGTYMSPDLVFAADHITQVGIESIAMQRAPEPHLYAVLGNGELAVLTYNRMYGVTAWSVWSSADAIVEDVAILDSSDGEEVYISVERGAIRTLEKFVDPYTAEWHMDCKHTVDTDGSGVPDTHDLDGEVDWTYLDENGSVVETLEPDSSYTRGIMYASYLQTNILEGQGPYGSSTTRVKRVNEVRVRVVNSGLCEVGYIGRRERSREEFPYTGDLRVPAPGTYGRDTKIEIHSVDGNPLMITAMVPDLEVV